MDDYWFWVLLGCTMCFGAWLWSRKIDREIRAVEKDVEQIFNKIIFMKTEQHDDKIFAYDAVTAEFICQGDDLEELSKNFGKRYPNRKGILVEAEETKGVL